MMVVAVVAVVAYGLCNGNVVVLIIAVAIMHSGSGN